LPNFIKYFLSGIAVFIFAATAYCQTHTIDSLQKIINSTTDSKQKTATVLAYLNEYESLPTDSIVRYYNKAVVLVQDDFTEEKKLELGIVKTRLLRRQNKVEGAIQFSDSLYNQYRLKKINPAIFRRLISIKSGLLIFQQKYKEALDLNYATLKKAEQENNEINQVFCQITIGWINMELAKNRDALRWFFNAVEHAKKINYTDKLGLVYANIAAVYGELRMTDSAEFFIHKAFDYAVPNQNLTVLANCYYIFSDIMVARKNIPAAEEAMNKGVEIRKKIADPFYYVSDLYQLAIFYANNNEPQKGIVTSLEAIEYAKQNNISGKYLILYDALAKNYKVDGNDKMYSATLEKILSLKDSLYKNNSAQSLADLQTKYEVQKKETLIAKQKLDLFQRNILLYGGAAAAALVLLFILYKFKKYQQRQKIALANMMEEEQMQKKKAIKEAEENERRRIAAELHDNLGVQANAILHNSNLLSDKNTTQQNLVTDLQETAKEMMLNLRETLWALKTADVNAMEMWLRIINFMKQMGRHYPNIHFTIEGDVPKKFIIPSAKALNIVLVIQETVNNAVKHATAKSIAAKSIFTDNEWKITIKDNGIGFNTAKGNDGKDNYGLINMRERAVVGKFEYILQSKLGSGTETFIVVTV